MSRTAAPPSLPPSAEPDGAFAPVEAPDTWHVLALVCFAASLASKPLARLVPVALRPRYAFLLPIALTLGFAFVGLILAWLGTRRPAIRGASRLALLLNAIVLGLGLLAAAAGVWILRR